MRTDRLTVLVSGLDGRTVAPDTSARQM